MFWIICSIILSLLLITSVVLNVRFFKAHSELVAFFDKEFKINEEDFKFIDRMANTNLLIVDPTIKNFHTRVKSVRDRYADYVKNKNFPKSTE
jgi:hypothetical protein